MMNSNPNSLAQFTNQYQLSKTLRFELKPVGRTAEWIKKNNIISVDNERNLTGVDAERATNYKYAKLLLDELHRKFIEEALLLDPEDEYARKLKDKIVDLYLKDEIVAADLPGSLLKKVFDNKAEQWISKYREEMPEYWRNEFEAKIASETNGKKRKYLESSLAKLLGKCEKTPFRKSGVEVLFGSTEDPVRLLEWAVRSEKIRPTFGDIKHVRNEDAIIPKEHIIEYIIRGFDNFSTYFSGFNENRANVYDVGGAKSTSLMHRVFVQNIGFHFSNIRKWSTVKKSLEKYADVLAGKNYDWRSLLDECERELSFSVADVFTPAAFISFINQSGIDRYNEIIGGRAQEGGKRKTQGINEFINLARQQAGAKRNEFPPLQLMYKQILSKNDKTYIPAFETDEEMFQRIKDFHQTGFVDSETAGMPLIHGFVEEMKRLVSESLNEKDTIFIAKDKLNRISQELTGSWNTINLRLLSTLGEKDFNKKTVFSIHQIDEALNAVVDGERFSLLPQNVKKEFFSDSEHVLFNFFVKRASMLLERTEESWSGLQKNGILCLEKLDGAREREGDKGFEQVAAIKLFLDSAIEFSGFVKDWMLPARKQADNINTVWHETLQKFCDSFPIVKLYNMVRNHVTKKPYSTEKIKVNFNNSTLLHGWDRNKESDNYGILLEKGGLYFLGIMTPGSNGIFDYEASDSDSSQKKLARQKLASSILCATDAPGYRKMNYKLLPGPNKMLPKVFFANSNIALFNPNAEIININKQKLYSKAEIEKHGIKNLHDYIDFCKRSLCVHPEWSRAFGFRESSFRQTADYRSIDEFYKDVEIQGYKISFDNIKESYINDKVAAGELYLFQIYCKDFSRNKKGSGNDNLHTSYWKLLFSEENLKDVSLKLNGQAEIFFRPSSIELEETKKRQGHHYEKLKDKFSYPIIKDRRFTEDKFFFHCPVAMNFKAPSGPGRFNDKINAFLRDNPDIRIIGIDRGEKHLLYYSVTDLSGNIIAQGSLNSIDGFQGRTINYHEKLADKEKNRDRARKSWSAIENIKELKAGYLSQIVHKLAELIIQHNAIVVLEDLNTGFKRGRFGVEKQVYQKFEKALIDKLNYLVFKNKSSRLEPGHYLNAYQLTNQFQSFEKLGRQSGILFYTAASYTSTTDPVTGFLKNVNISYENVEASRKFWESFDSIVYNQAQDRFEFTYTIGKVAGKSISREKNEEKISKRQWTVCSCVIRSRYVKPAFTEEQKQTADREGIGRGGRHEVFHATEEIKKLLGRENVDYIANPDIQKALLERCGKKDASLHRSLTYYFNAIMTVRVTDSNNDSGTNENDFILSPVEPFFDSRKAYAGLPENGDANGAYNIARKGICILHKINEADDVSKVKPTVSKQEWQEYAQSDAVVKTQHPKLDLTHD